MYWPVVYIYISSINGIYIICSIPIIHFADFTHILKWAHCTWGKMFDRKSFSQDYNVNIMYTRVDMQLLFILGLLIRPS